MVASGPGGPHDLAELPENRRIEREATRTLADIRGMLEFGSRMESTCWTRPFGWVREEVVCARRARQSIPLPQSLSGVRRQIEPPRPAALGIACAAGPVPQCGR